MKTRIITAIVALAVFAGVMLAPSSVFPAVLSAVILFMLYECYKAVKASVSMRIAGFISALGLMLCMNTIKSENDPKFVYVFMAVTAVILLHMALIIALHGRRSYKDILTTGFLTLYVTVSMWCIQFMNMSFGKPIMLLIFISAWACDTFAYFTGKLMGKHKLIPHVSPNKTVEGSIGGILGDVVFCILYLFVLSKIMKTDNSIAKNYMIFGLVIGLTGGIFSQIGDLLASAIKRDEDIKDFGWIFPGHGGFMDRFDSVMYIAPIIYIFSVLLQTGG